ncbi:MAG: hypothetical protein NWR72_01825 [Bacteroidia bacterium]|nr:hypothetical protein [Bacteroidia bacterium]
MILILLYSIPLSGQEKYEWSQDSANQAFGIDDYLVNGRPYAQQHLGAAGHPYLYQQEWQTGSIFINGHEYEESSIRFDLSTQTLVLRYTNPQNASVPIALSGHLVDSFDIGQSRLINSAHTGHPKDSIGYAEVLYRGKFEVYRELSRQFLASYNALTPKGSFSEVNTRYLLHSVEDHRWQEFQSLAAMLKAFPDKGKEIRKIARQSGIRLKKADSQSITQILTSYHETR